MSDQPAGGAEETGVAVALADELDAQGQAVGPLHQRHADGWHPAQGPQRAESGVTSRGQTLRRRAVSGRSQDGVVALLEQLDEALVHRPDAGQRALVVEGPHLAAALDLGPERRRKPIASELPFPP